MKIRWLVFHRVLWFLALALLLAAALVLLQWANAPSISDIDVIVYPIYTSRFPTLFFVVFGLACAFSLMRYAQIKSSNTDQDVWAFIVLVMVFTFFGISVFWPLLGVIIGIGSHIYTRRICRNTVDRSLWLGLGLVLLICLLITLHPTPSNLHPEDTAQLDGYTYHVAHYLHQRFSELSMEKLPDPSLIRVFYQCDRWGVVCHLLYHEDLGYYGIFNAPSPGESTIGKFLRTDPIAHTVSLVLDDEVVYTDYTGE